MILDKVFTFQQFFLKYILVNLFIIDFHIWKSHLVGSEVVKWMGFTRGLANRGSVNKRATISSLYMVHLFTNYIFSFQEHSGFLKYIFCFRWPINTYINNMHFFLKYLQFGKQKHLVSGFHRLFVVQKIALSFMEHVTINSIRTYSIALLFGHTTVPHR